MADKSVKPTAETWRKRVESWKASGLSQSAWSTQNNIHPNSFHYWVKKLSGSPDKPAVTTNSLEIPGFIALSVTDRKQAGGHNGLNNGLGRTVVGSNEPEHSGMPFGILVGKFHIDVAHNFDAGDLKRLLIVLDEIA
jgi:hypothetical protein